MSKLYSDRKGISLLTPVSLVAGQSVRYLSEAKLQKVREAAADESREPRNNGIPNCPSIRRLCSFFAERLLNNRLQMRGFGATKKVVRQTKQTKIGLCEQVRVN